MFDSDTTGLGISARIKLRAAARRQPTWRAATRDATSSTVPSHAAVSGLRILRASSRLEPLRRPALYAPGTHLDSRKLTRRRIWRAPTPLRRNRRVAVGSRGIPPLGHRRLRTSCLDPQRDLRGLMRQPQLGKTLAGGSTRTFKKRLPVVRPWRALDRVKSDECGRPAPAGRGSRSIARHPDRWHATRLVRSTNHRRVANRYVAWHWIRRLAPILPRQPTPFLSFHSEVAERANCRAAPRRRIGTGSVPTPLEGVARAARCPPERQGASSGRVR